MKIYNFQNNMPISSKIIIKQINTHNGHFTRKDLINELINPKIDKGKGKNNKKRKKVYKSEKDISRIEETLNALIGIGFISKNKNKFIRESKSNLEGKIIINSSGNGIVLTDTGEEIVIYKENTNKARNNDHVSIKLTDYRKNMFFGEVHKIVKRDKEECLARVVKKTKGAIFYTLVDIPGNTEVCSERFENEPELNDLVLIEIENKLLCNRNRCKVIKHYSHDDEKNDVARIIIKYNLPKEHKDYEELKDINQKIPAIEFKNRKDYRKLFTITIDGEDAKDFDDAISINKNRNNIILYIHIADVSAYVQKDSELDREALKRGTSYYLGNYVIPMLPEQLSNDLCSLKEGVDRLTLSVEITFDLKGNIVSSTYNRGLIRVDKRLTYVLSNEILEGKGGIKFSKLKKTLQQMYDLSQLLKNKRLDEGRLDLNISEEKMIFENNKIKEIQFAQRLKSHMLIEEFMLSANVVISEILKDKKVPTLYRIHEKISTESFIALKNFLRVFNIKLSVSGNLGKNIQHILQIVSNKEYEHVVNFAVLKSLMQAYYGIEPLGHFGLGFADYTHFTSPIRRYPDLIVHRCLKSLIDNKEPSYTSEALIFIGEKSSEMERVAQSAERDLIKIKSCRLMEDRIGELFDGIISGVTKFGLFVTLQEMPIEGMIPLKNITDDYYIIKEDEYTIIGKRYGKRYRLGDKIKIKLSNVEIDKMWIDFDLA